MKAKAKRTHAKEKEVEQMDSNMSRTTLILAVFVVINIVAVAVIIQQNTEKISQSIVGQVTSISIRNPPEVTPGIIEGEKQFHVDLPSDPVLASTGFIHYKTNTYDLVYNAIIQDLPMVEVDDVTIWDKVEDEDPLGFFMVHIRSGSVAQYNVALDAFGEKYCSYLEGCKFVASGSTVEAAGSDSPILYFATDDDEDNENEWYEDDEYGNLNTSQSLPLMGFPGAFGSFDVTGAGVTVCIVDMGINSTHTTSEFTSVYNAKTNKYGLAAGVSTDKHGENMYDAIKAAAPGASYIVSYVGDLTPSKSKFIKGMVNGCYKNKKGTVSGANIPADIVISGVGFPHTSIINDSATVEKVLKKIKSIKKSVDKYERLKPSKKLNENPSSTKYNPKTRLFVFAAGQAFPYVSGTFVQGYFNRLGAIPGTLLVTATGDETNDNIIYTAYSGSTSCSKPLKSKEPLCDAACTNTAVSAPGFAITLGSGETVEGAFGTSMAAAHVAGAAALIKETNPTLLLAELLGIIKTTSVNNASSFGVDASCQGVGFVDTLAAVTAASTHP